MTEELILSLPRDDSGSPIAWEEDNYRITLYNTSNYFNAYLMHNENSWKQIGSLKTKISTKKINGTKIKYTEVSSISLHKEHQNKGFGTQLYKTLLKYLPYNVVGIGSNLKQRINKEAIPKIYEKLGYESYNDGYFQLIKKNTL
jgi:ribosomal protein S18 acetylase RimI-like enzyme